jgi:Flp pilus assembly protein TadG
MRGSSRSGVWTAFGSRRVPADDCGSQVVELALSLPLLVLFVVGIFDFSGALALKQKLTNAAREGARVAAADPANDLSNASDSDLPTPVSVSDAYQVVDNYLLSDKINDCGLGGSITPKISALTWTYTSTGSGCPATGITLTINRGCLTPEGGPPTVNVVNTCVTITYPYSWRFTGVSALFGGGFAAPTGITTTAVAFNEN